MHCKKGGVTNFVLLVLIAIAPSITPASADEQPDAKRILRMIGQARSIHVRSSVTGMLGRKEVNYSFLGKSAQWSRTGRCSGSMFRKKGDFQTSRNFSLPDGAIRAILNTLEESETRVDDYRPVFRITDYYPEIQIVIGGGTGWLRFFSKSQGPRFIPWAVDTGSQTLVIRGDGPMRAIEILYPYLGINSLLDLCK
jgi:hypothetical protein